MQVSSQCLEMCADTVTPNSFLNIRELVSCALGFLTLVLTGLSRFNFFFPSYRGMARECGGMQNILISLSTIPTESRLSVTLCGQTQNCLCQMSPSCFKITWRLMSFQYHSSHPTILCAFVTTQLIPNLQSPSLKLITDQIKQDFIATQCLQCAIPFDTVMIPMTKNPLYKHQMCHGSSLY